MSGGILQHEPAQQLLVMLSGAAHRCLQSMGDVSAGDMDKFRQGLASIPNLSAPVIRDEVDQLTSEFPAFPDCLKTVVMMTARDQHSQDLSTHRIHVKLPSTSEALHYYFTFLSRSPHVQNGDYLSNPFSLESRVVLGEALRSMLSNVLYERITLLPRELGIPTSNLTKSSLSHLMGDVRPDDSVSQVGGRSRTSKRSRATRVSHANPPSERSHSHTQASTPKSVTTHVSVRMDGSDSVVSEEESAFSSAMRSVSRASRHSNK